jgi:hypothetical protein
MKNPVVWQVVRMEIRSRMSATNKLKEAVNRLKHEGREEMKGLAGSVDERVGRMERKVEVLLAAERKLYARQSELEAGVRQYEALVTDAVAELRDEVEEAAVNQVGQRCAHFLLQLSYNQRVRFRYLTFGSI